MKRLALFSLLAFSLLIGNFGVAPVIASFSSDTTQVSREQEVEWETYHNHKYGWSIDYPPDWEVNGSDPESVIFIGKDGINSTVVCEKLPFPINVEEYFASVSSKGSWSYSPRVSERRTEIGGESAIEVIYPIRRFPDSPLTKERRIVTTRDSVGYVIVCSAPSTLYNKADKTYFKPMIQSFKFE